MGILSSNTAKLGDFVMIFFAGLAPLGGKSRITLKWLFFPIAIKDISHDSLHFCQ